MINPRIQLKTWPTELLVILLLLQIFSSRAAFRQSPLLLLRLRGGQDPSLDKSTLNYSKADSSQVSGCKVGNTTEIVDSSQNSSINATKEKTFAKERKSKKKSSMSSPQTRASSRSDTARRIQREWKDLVVAGMGFDWQSSQPVRTKRMNNETINPQYIWIGPLSMQNLYIWHFSFVGVEGSPYENGIYHGRMVLPRDYPSNPPQVQLWTPSGRFVVRTNICLSASSYHPETWTASWTIRTLTQALRLHMLTHGNEIGGISSCSNAERADFARKSESYHVQIKYGDSSKRSITVNHAAMIKDGLFPLAVKDAKVEKQDDMAESDADFDQSEAETAEQRGVNREELMFDTALEEVFERKSNLGARQHRRSGPKRQVVTVSASSILQEALGGPLKVALCAFLVIFVLLNR